MSISGKGILAAGALLCLLLSSCSGRVKGRLDLQTARDQSRAYLEETAPLGKSHDEKLEFTEITFDAQDMAHAKVQQTVDGVPVFGGEAIVHLNTDGAVSSFTNELKVQAKPRSTRPALSEARARAIALKSTGLLSASTQIQLWVLPTEGSNRLSYEVRLRSQQEQEEPRLPVVFVDATNGEVLWTYENLQSARGASLYDGQVEVSSIRAATKRGTMAYFLEDPARRVGTFDARNMGNDRGRKPRLYRIFDPDDIFEENNQRVALQAQFGAEKVMDYFKTVHNRNGLDGKGGAATFPSVTGDEKVLGSIVHFGRKYSNAYWDGEMMVYGDGDGRRFFPLTTLDITGHEMTHGVTQFSAHLTYSGESGALNESISDIFGAMVERFVRGDSDGIWKVGEDAYTPAKAGDALRYMNNPQKGAQPDHYSGYKRTSSDNGGVHTNSGIPNHVFYLLAAGGTHRMGGSMQGIGSDAAAKIFYKALTGYLTRNAKFKDARKATTDAARSLYGEASPELAAVEKAWTLCGVNP